MINVAGGKQFITHIIALPVTDGTIYKITPERTISFLNETVLYVCA